MQKTKNVDAVITYVDSSDEQWQETLSTYANLENEDINLTRFRSYGTLLILVKCIRKFMSFIDTIYIVVSSRSQIRKDVEQQDNVIFITHDMIMPDEILPVFNSQAIEQFLHKIPNLKEHYIYFNDDMFPVKYLSENDFFKDEKPVWRLKHLNQLDIKGGFRNVCMNSYMLAYAVFHKENNFNDILIPFHSISPMFKSDSEEIYRLYEKTILDTVTRFRRRFNLNQYLYSLYSVLKRGYYEQQDNFFKYIPLNQFYTESDDWLETCKYKIVCLNDTQDLMNFKDCRTKIIRQLNSIL